MTLVEPTRRLLCGLLLGLILLAFAVPAARAAGTTPEVWLVTYGPGEIYWQRFGHNAIWVRDPGLGLDHTFNFGFFDFDQENFLKRFVQGRMLYFSAAQQASDEFAQYIDDNRSIRAQRLALPPEQALDLTDFLVNEVQPENRNYLYDYYLDNCSTRVRDALDRALAGRLSEAYSGTSAAQNFRDHTRRLTQSTYWLYLGLELGLGAPVDRSISRWEEFFIPAELAEGAAAMGHDRGQSTGPPLVLEDVMIHQSVGPQPPPTPSQTWPRYLAPALALLALGAILGRFGGAKFKIRLAVIWLSLAGIVGSALFFFWFGTDHSAAANNFNVLVFNPLWLLALVGRRIWRTVAGLVAVGALAAVLAPLLPPHQYTADVIAAFLPLNLAAAWLLLRVGRDEPPRVSVA